MKSVCRILAVLVVLIMILPHTFASSIPSSGIAPFSDIMDQSVIDGSYSIQPLIITPSDVSLSLFEFSPQPFYVGYRSTSGVISNVTYTRSVPSAEQFVRTPFSNGVLFLVPANVGPGIYLASSSVNDGDYLYLMDANNQSSSAPDVSVDFVVSSPSRNVSTLSLLLHTQASFGFIASNAVSMSYGTLYNFWFTNLYIYYIDRNGNEVALGNYPSNNGGNYYFYYPDLTFELNQFVSEVHYRFSSPMRLTTNVYQFLPSLTNGSFFVRYNGIGNDAINPGYAPPDEDIPLQIWSQILDILKYLQNPMQVTLESILQAIKDGGSATGAVTVIVQQINNTVTNIANTVNNVLRALTPDPSQDDDANAFESAMGGLSDAVESDASALESLSPRPSPSDVVTTIPPDMMSPSDPDVKRGISVFSDIMSSLLIMPILIVVFTLATVRFILFGKRG